MLVKQFSSVSRKHQTISPDLCTPNSVVDYRICGLMQEHVYIVQTPVNRLKVICKLQCSVWSIYSKLSHVHI